MLRVLIEPIDEPFTHQVIRADALTVPCGQSVICFSDLVIISHSITTVYHLLNGSAHSRSRNANGVQNLSDRQKSGQHPSETARFSDQLKNKVRTKTGLGGYGWLWLAIAGYCGLSEDTLNDRSKSGQSRRGAGGCRGHTNGFFGADRLAVSLLASKGWGHTKWFENGQYARSMLVRGVTQRGHTNMSPFDQNGSQ